MRVLIVDDDAVFADQLARSLGRRGLECHLASDAGSALSQVGARRFDAALLDLRLATESGLELVRPLRTLAPDLVIVLLTGYASVATAVDAIKRGADDYLPKPCSVEVILRALRRADPRPAGAAAAASPDAPQAMLPLQRVEWEHIQQAMAETGGNVSAAARLLGVHRRSLQRKLGKRPQNDPRASPLDGAVLDLVDSE